MSNIKKKEHHIQPFKILAQSIGILVCLFFLLFIIGEGVPDIISGKANGLFIFLPLLLLPVVGYFMTWFQETTGTFLMITGGIALLSWFLIMGDVKMALVYGLPFIITGGLFLLHIVKRNALKKHN